MGEGEKEEEEEKKTKKKKKKIPKTAERLRQYFAAIAIGVPVRPLFLNALIKQKTLVVEC